MTRDMTISDRMRLKAHRGSHRLFQQLIEGANGQATRVCDLTPSNWMHLRTLLEFEYVNVEEGSVIIQFTVSSLLWLGYV